MKENNVLSVKNIVKTYDGVVALDDVSIDFREGEIHALVGENGAGKSTLIKIIAGATKQDKGDIILDGKMVSHMTPKLSKDLGISVIYQELLIFPELSVSENLYLCSETKHSFFIKKREMAQKTDKIFEDLKIKMNLKAKAKDLSIAYRQMIEIARALSRNTKILIMDEPSATLTEDEVDVMLNLLKDLKNKGVTVIYISHRLEEIFKIADRITILRDGQHIATVDAEKTNKKELIKYMVGRNLSEVFPERILMPTETGMEIRSFSGNGVHDISLSVRHGEILGIGGLVGSGRTELAQLIFGVKPLESGQLLLEGKKIRVKSPKEAVKHGIALVPEDRKKQGLLMQTSISENISIPSMKKLSKLLFINRKKETTVVEKLKSALRIKAPSLKQFVSSLSGGNQQKVVLAKWLATECNYIIFDEPTRGIDVGAKQEIYKLLNQLASEGKCILMISSEMEELIGISDRIVVFCEGRMMGELTKAEFNQETIMTMASGE